MAISLGCVIDASVGIKRFIVQPNYFCTVFSEQIKYAASKNVSLVILSAVYKDFSPSSTESSICQVKGDKAIALSQGLGGSCLQVIKADARFEFT